MIYLFDRLYLESDHYIRNDKKKMTALLGESAKQAKSCGTLQYDFGQMQLDESVDNKDLAKYLTDLIKTADGDRVTVYTDDATIIKILAFYCSSIFVNPTAEFIKSLIMFDKLWIDLGPGVAGHRDSNLRHKGIDKLDITDIDALIAEGMSITPKITGFTDVRIEYTLAAYINNTLPAKQKNDFELKIKEIFYDSAWLGDLIKTFTPEYLTLAHNKGVDLDTFTTSTLKNTFPAYFKIYDTSLRGDPTCFDRVSLTDCVDFIDAAKVDFGWDYPLSHKDFLVDFYKDKMGFIRDKVLSPSSISDYFCALNLGKMVKANPYLWYAIGGSADNKAYLDQFTLNV